MGALAVPDHSGFDIADVKSGHANEEGGDGESSQDAERFGDARPGDGMSVDMHPDSEMIWQ